MVALNSEQKKDFAGRVVLNDTLLARFDKIMDGRSVPELARRTGLPYALIYNIYYRRVKSITARQFRIIFSQDPPAQEVGKVDGAFFRQMADLWLYLNEGLTQKTLYRQLLGTRGPKKVDSRLFSGRTRTVPPLLEQKMLARFSDAGVDEFTLRQWIAERRVMDNPDRVAYARIRPLLLHLQESLGVHPTSVLNQLFDRYESGELKTVSRRIYEKALRLNRQVNDMPGVRQRATRERLREQVYGPRQGYTLFSAIEAELHFLRQYAGKSPTAYLGRGTNIYKKRKARRIATWRAEKVRRDCAAFIRRNPDLPLSSLPASHRIPQLHRLVSVLSARLTDLLAQGEGLVLEKKILAPAYARHEYKNQVHGFTQFDKAPTALGMDKKAFDLMVSSNCEIFREVGRYAERWYLSDLYLKELVRRPHAELIFKKYEWLARRIRPGRIANHCLQ